MLHRKDRNVRSAEPSWSCCSPNSYNTHTSRVNTVNTHPTYTSLNQKQDKSHRMVSSPYYQRNPQTPASSESSWATRKASASKKKKKIKQVKNNYTSTPFFIQTVCCFQTTTLTRLNAPTPSFTPPSKCPWLWPWTYSEDFRTVWSSLKAQRTHTLTEKKILVFRCIQ